MRRRPLAASLTLAVALALPLPHATHAAQSQQATLFFSQTGHGVAFGFRRFFEARGGLGLFGYPITDEMVENGLTVQYFQRARFEYHPELAGTRYEVQLGLLDDALTAGRRFAPGKPQSGATYFPETKHNVRDAFLRFYKQYGGVDIFGLPTSEEVQEGGLTVQHFQRARFEYHPELPPAYTVSLGLVGEEYLARQRALAAAGSLPIVGGRITVPGLPAAGPDGPILRVGIFSTGKDPVSLTSSGGATLVDDSGATRRHLAAGDVVTVAYNANRHEATLPDGSRATAPGYFRLQPDPGSILAVASMPRDQRYRGTLEVRYSTVSNRLWVIDELPLEDYVKGVSEETENTPEEALKAAAVVYRSYALYRLSRPSNEPFNLASSTSLAPPYEGKAQIYSGYSREANGPRLAAAVAATRGQVVTYHGQPVVTPYYSSSDGRTRSWAEVWGGTGYEWLVSVPDPDGVGDTLRGHGVGLPMHSAVARALAGWAYDRILAYFYTGICINTVY